MYLCVVILCCFINVKTHTLREQETMSTHLCAVYIRSVVWTKAKAERRKRERMKERNAKITKLSVRVKTDDKNRVLQQSYSYRVCSLIPFVFLIEMKSLWNQSWKVCNRYNTFRPIEKWKSLHRWISCLRFCIVDKVSKFNTNYIHQCITYGTYMCCCCWYICGGTILHSPLANIIMCSLPYACANFPRAHTHEITGHASLI